MLPEKPQLDEFEKSELVLRNESFEKLVNNFSLLISGADILEKEIFASGEFLLVAGGIKPATEFDLPNELIGQLEVANIVHENIISDLKSRFEKIGLKMSNPRKIFDDNAVSTFFVYNPKLLILRSQKLPALIPFSEADDLDLWIAENRGTGIDIDLIRGGLFGFPQSSIESYIAYKHHTKGLHKLKNEGIGEAKEFAEKELKAIREKEEKSRHAVRSYGEVYMSENPNAPDVLAHERIKKEFFENLEKNREPWSLLEKTRKEADWEEYKLSKDI